MKKSKYDLSNYSDIELRDAIINDADEEKSRQAIEYLLCKKCIATIEFHLRRFFNENEMELNEAVSEVYLYLAEKNWHKLRQFTGRNGASLKTYISTVVRNYFQNKAEKTWKEPQKQLINDNTENNIPDKTETFDFGESLNTKVKIEKTLERMSNIRYRTILQMLYEDKKPNEIAAKLGIGMPVYYNKFRLARKQFEELYNQYYKYE
ncbi:MAG: DUF1492 domain-containing protein [Prevotellaceae bacterium]|jgi:DNA-directed RNA polymerase specialized sigma24 family protein|nr:DUF1492 domain-containing protein [Prevotellaceae bacterium]